MFLFDSYSPLLYFHNWHVITNFYRRTLFPLLLFVCSILVLDDCFQTACFLYNLELQIIFATRRNNNCRFTIMCKNNEKKDKFYRKVAFLMNTEMGNFWPQSWKAASKLKPHGGLCARLQSSWQWSRDSLDQRRNI